MNRSSIFPRLPQRCRYYEVCELYSEDGATCNTYDAEGGYCGRYKQLAKSQMRRTQPPDAAQVADMVEQNVV